MKKVFFLMISLLSMSGNAYWMTQIDDDLFSGGKTGMLLGEINQHYIAVDCSTDGELSLSYLEEVSDLKRDVPPVPVNIAIKIDQNDVIKAKAVAKKRNDKVIAMTTTDKDSIVLFLEQLKKANSKVTLGLEIGGERLTFSGDVRNSTKSVNKLNNACNLKIDDKRNLNKLPSNSTSFLDGYYRERESQEGVMWETILSEPNKISFIVNSCTFSVDLKRRNEYWEGYLGNDFDGVACGSYFNNIPTGRLLMLVNPIKYSKNGKVLSFSVNPTDEFRSYVNSTEGISKVAREYFGSSGIVYDAD